MFVDISRYYLFGTLCNENGVEIQRAKKMDKRTGTIVGDAIDNMQSWFAAIRSTSQAKKLMQEQGGKMIQYVSNQHQY
jgi:hypothetical protein